MGDRILDCRPNKPWLGQVHGMWLELEIVPIEQHLNMHGIGSYSSDDTGWLPDDTVFERYESRFLDNYSTVKCFHACKPAYIASYFERGLLGQCASTTVASFKEIFCDIDDDILDAAIASMSERLERERGKVYLDCDDSRFVTEFGHVLVRGGEILIGLTNKISKYEGIKFDPHERLKTTDHI